MKHQDGGFSPRNDNDRWIQHLCQSGYLKANLGLVKDINKNVN